ncbi:MAG: SDR family oxidoreductase [Puia sp.]|nr:SDR family oxidoreductase [Puia sp.]
MKKLANKVAVITGGSSGLGLATAKLFAEEGAKVAITGRNSAALDEAVKAIGLGSIGIVADVANIREIETGYKKIYDSFGKFDVLIVNAGIYFGAALADFTEELFDKISNVNFKGAFFSVQKALPYLNSGASIVLTSTALNEKGLAPASAYSATKAAIRSLGRSFAAELTGKGIRVNVLSPGAIVTPIFEKSVGSREELDGTLEYFSNYAPQKRMGKPEEIAAGFLYLASDDSTYMLGSELVIDGGVKGV